MDCKVIQDLLPLYMDDCCSRESARIVENHIQNCPRCKAFYENMKTPAELSATFSVPVRLNRINDWKASVLQSILLFVSFAIITVGVALEAGTPEGITNGQWAFALILPATGFMLSLANWYFVRLYPNRKTFSSASCFATLGATVLTYIWAVVHYEVYMFSAFLASGLVLTVLLCFLSKILSAQYAKMLGKE